MRPWEVRCRKPSWMRYGSWTSSRVLGSSPTAMAMVERPTGPPLKFWAMVSKMRLSISSRPRESISRSSRAAAAIS